MEETGPRNECGGLRAGRTARTGLAYDAPDRLTQLIPYRRKDRPRRRATMRLRSTSFRRIRAEQDETDGGSDALEPETAPARDVPESASEAVEAAEDTFLRPMTMPAARTNRLTIVILLLPSATT